MFFLFVFFLYENISFAFKRVVTCSASKNKRGTFIHIIALYVNGDDKRCDYKKLFGSVTALCALMIKHGACFQFNVKL